MEFGHDNVRQAVEEDRLSRLPDELIHKILFSFDMKFVVQTCLVSTRWKLLWTSMPFLNFSSGQFGTLPEFAGFVTHILSHRNHKIKVFSVKLCFEEAANEELSIEIANYAFSHNVQHLEVIIWPVDFIKKYPPFLFSSQSLKHFTFTVNEVLLDFIHLDTPMDFPALTTMHLSNIALCGDLFSKCANLKNLTLQDIYLEDVEVLDIITPHLSNLMLIDCDEVKVINLVAPQLENLTVINFSSIEYLNGPPGLLPLSKNGFHSLNKVTLCLHPYEFPETERDARNTIKMLQQLHSARHLTLGAYIIKCLSSFPDLLSPHASPFSNLISLTIDSSKMSDAHKVKMSTEATNFLLGNSPDSS